MNLTDNPWHHELTKKLEKQINNLPENIRVIVYSLMDDLEEVYSIRSKKKNWRDIFFKELSKHGEPGLYLKGLRLRENYTQAELGELIGTSPNNISAMEHGRRSIGKEIAHRLAKVFRTDYRRFL